MRFQMTRGAAILHFFEARAELSRGGACWNSPQSDPGDGTAVRDS